jgi:ABC-type multidrug transport system ATPase subunit
MLISGVSTLFFSALAMVCQYLMISLGAPSVKVRNFSTLRGLPDTILLVDDGTFPDFSVVKDHLLMMFRQETGRTIQSRTFKSETELNDFVFEWEGNYQPPLPIGIGYSIDNGTQLFLASHFNTSYWDGISEELTCELMGTRALWKYTFGADTDFALSFTQLTRRQIDLVFGRIGPILIGCGLVSIIPMFVTQPILDMTGEVRSYMESCTLTILPYWIATFTVDLCIWVVVTTCIWAVMQISQIQAFLDNVFPTWYVITMAGPSFILFTYCMSFLFDSVASATRISFMTFVVLLLIPFVVISCRGWIDNPLWLDGVYSLIPHLCINQLYMLILMNMGPFSQPFKFYWTERKAALIYLVMEFVNIVLYTVILTVIERYRRGIESSAAKRTFDDYAEHFEKVRAQHELAAEVREMEDLVKGSHDFAVRIDNVSRLFFDSEGNPIPAVNSVSLGVRRGALFGFLGANGAGKTTLIRMITGLLPISNGDIEVNGRDIGEFHDPTAISICPQFNNHLCYEMTFTEHFQLYGMIFEMDAEVAMKKAAELMNSLHLEAIADKQIQDLSQGDVRKLAIALSFFGPAQIILLDEPTASLDPVARRDVQEMILEAKGTKTFMLCTHLLSEAEFLCDMISIMVKGCVYTVGTPQMLTEKFGKDFKIDIMLEDESDAVGQKCDKFFEERLPAATLSIIRPKARIYDIPATKIELCDLFDIMDEGFDEGIGGFTYFTCSSSSLERVFMEIVKISEQE